KIAKFAERDHVFAAAAEGDALERRCSHLVEPAGALGHAPKRGVMMHHGLAVGADLQIDFDAVVARERRAHCAGGIFDHAGFGVMQTAVCKRPRGQPVAFFHPSMIRKSGHRLSEWIMLHDQATSKDASTSMAQSAGRTAPAMVLRACRPLSPKAATIRSEAPFITFGPSRKFGAELTKPPSRTTRTTLSRSPSAAFTWPSTLMAQARAAFWPCSIDTPAPSLPVATSLPPS